MEARSPRKLPLSVAIEPEESALGYALRSLQINGIDFDTGTRWLGLARLQPAREPLVRRLAWLLNTDPEALSSRIVMADPNHLWIQLAGHRFKRHAVSPTQYAKLCPLCVRERAIARLSWLLRATVGCVRHGYSLQRTCQNCGSAIRWGRPGIEFCCCGYPFKAPTAVTPLEPDVQAWLEWLEQTLLPPAQGLVTERRQPGLPKVLTHMSIDGAFRVVEALGLCAESNTSVRLARQQATSPRELGRVIARGLSRLREIEADPSAARRLSSVAYHNALIDVSGDFAASEDQALAWWLLTCMRTVEPGPTRAGVRPKGQLPLF